MAQPGIAVQWLDGTTGLFDPQTCPPPWESPAPQSVNLYPLGVDHYVLESGTTPCREVTVHHAGMLILAWGYQLPAFLSSILTEPEDEGVVRPVLTLASRAFQGPPVILAGRSASPIVSDEPQAILLPAQYDVVEVLNAAGKAGLTQAKLRRLSGHGDARAILKRIKALSEVWNLVIFMSGKTRRGYRIGLPTPTYPQLGTLVS